jgi:hypothetical protein
MEAMSLHPGELKLRRLRAGEIQGIEGDGLVRHLEGCGRCRARIKELEQEQEQFEQEISFDRFSAGVQRAVKSIPPRRASWKLPAMGMAAAVLAAIVIGPLLKRPPIEFGTRVKGGASIALRIGGMGTGSQRLASAHGVEPLAPGERVRIGYQAGNRRYLVAISIDQRGTVTELYGEEGSSLRVAPGDETRYLPDSLEFTGNGLERVIVVLSDEPLELTKVKQAAEAAYNAVRGDLRQLPKLDVPGEQFHRLLLKP